MTVITGVDVVDVRFPTSLTADGSDAMNKDGDYSAAYVVLHTDNPELSGYGFTFTIGRGNDLCVAAAEQRALPLIGRNVEEITSDLGGIYRELQSDSQLRWLGPEKGVDSPRPRRGHERRVGPGRTPCRKAAVEAAGRDDTGRARQRRGHALPLGRAHPRRSPGAARRNLEGTRKDRIAQLDVSGYPSYTTTAGWLGYSDDKLRMLCQEAVDSGYRHIKLKVGADLQDDIRRCSIAREVIGDDAHLMIDANQVWDVPEAIEWVSALAEFKPLWIEEPTSPDDILGHAAVRKAVAPIGVATGEHGMNRVLFKQMFQAEAIDFCQLDACRLGSVNEILSVLFMAAKFGVPVCPHAGGVGLCELVQHLSIFDFVAVSGSLEGRVTEFVDHLHEHFVDPCIVRDGAYVLPSVPGYSAEMFESTLAEFSFPAGTYWAEARNAAPISV